MAGENDNSVATVEAPATPEAAPQVQDSPYDLREMADWEPGDDQLTEPESQPAVEAGQPRDEQGRFASPAPAAPAAQPEAIPPEVLERAKLFGLNEEEARGFTPEVFDKFERLIVARGAQQAAQEYERAQQSQQPAHQQAQPAPAQPAVAGDLNFDALKDKFEPEIVESLNGIKKWVETKYDAKYQQLEAAYNQLAEHHFHNQLQQVYAEASKHIDSLPAYVHEAIGKTGARSATQQAEFERTLMQADIIARGFKASNLSAPPWQECIDMAVRSLHGDKAKQQVQQEVEKKIAERRSGAVQKPVQRHGREPSLTPEQRAAQFVERFKRENPNVLGTDD